MAPSLGLVPISFARTAEAAPRRKAAAARAIFVLVIIVLSPVRFCLLRDGGPHPRTTQPFLRFVPSKRELTHTDAENKVREAKRGRGARPSKKEAPSCGGLEVGK